MAPKRQWWGVACLLVLAATSVAQADAARGRAIYERTCMGCHSVDTNRVGPRHRGVVGRRAGTVDDFEYSPALRASAIVWDESELRKWLRGPTRRVPGTAMGFSLSSEEDIGHVIDYLKTLK